MMPKNESWGDEWASQHEEPKEELFKPVVVRPEQESDQKAAQVFKQIKFSELAKGHMAKRDAIIAHLRKTEGLSFTKGRDIEAFKPVQKALYETNSELEPERAAEIFREAKTGRLRPI